MNVVMIYKIKGKVAFGLRKVIFTYGRLKVFGTDISLRYDVAKFIFPFSLTSFKVVISGIPDIFIFLFTEFVFFMKIRFFIFF